MVGAKISGLTSAGRSVLHALVALTSSVGPPSLRQIADYMGVTVGAVQKQIVRLSDLRLVDANDEGSRRRWYATPHGVATIRHGVNTCSGVALDGCDVAGGTVVLTT